MLRGLGLTPVPRGLSGHGLAPATGDLDSLGLDGPAPAPATRASIRVDVSEN